MNTKELGYIGLGAALSTSEFEDILDTFGKQLAATWMSASELDKEALVDDSIKSVQSFLDKLYKIKVDNYGN